MSLFLAIFFCLYSLLHAYAFVKVRTAFGFGYSVGVPLAIAMLFMVAAPVIIRFAEFHTHDGTARLLGFIGYTWMGLIFLFSCSSFLIDLSRLALYTLRIVLGANLDRLYPGPKTCFYVSFVCTLLVALYGSFEAIDIRINQVVIRTSKILPQPGIIRIAQISDVHLGLLVRHHRLARILNEVKKADPDIVVSTGDLVDGQLASLNGLDEMLQNIRTRYGKFAVTGNHEYYAGIEHSLDFTRRSGFAVLHGETVKVTDGLTIAGVDDPAGPGYAQQKADLERVLLSKLPQSHFILFLKHRPSISAGTVGLFDLQLSGHVHAGQIFPFRLITRLFYPFVSGYFPLEKGSSLHVSRGSGTWGPPIRFLAPPEVTVITLVYEKGANAEMAK